MKEKLSKEQIQMRLDIVSQHGHGDRFGKFSNDEHSCIYVWKVEKHTVQWEAIDNGVRVSLKTDVRSNFVKYLLKTHAQIHWTVGA